MMIRLFLIVGLFMNQWWLLALLFSLACLVCGLIIYPLRRYFIFSLFLVPLIFIISGTGYYYWGGFSQWQGYVHQQETQKQAEAMLKSIKSPQELIEKLRTRLDDTPKSAKGWYLLGRLYSGQNEQQKATDAFAKAYHFNPNEEQYAVNYAHSLWQLNNRQFTPQITRIFSHLLKNNPNQPDALSMMAMDAFTQHAYEQAIGYWQHLLTLAPPQSDEAQAIRKAIVKAEEQMNKQNKR